MIVGNVYCNFYLYLNFIMYVFLESEEIEIRRLSQLKENFEKQQEDLRLVKHDLAQKTLDYEDVCGFL